MAFPDSNFTPEKRRINKSKNGGGRKLRLRKALMETGEDHHKKRPAKTKRCGTKRDEIWTARSGRKRKKGS